MMQRPRAVAFVVALLTLLGAPVARADPADDARNAALALIDAMDALVDAQGARDQVTALTLSIQAHEAALTDLRNSLREATLREAALRHRFEQRSEDVSRLMAAMMATGRMEGPALLVHPAGPLGTARAGMLLADLAPTMQAEAEELGSALREMETLRALRGTAVDTLSMGLRTLQDARSDLSQAMADRRDLPPRIADDETRMMELLASAQTLEALANGLAARPDAPPDAPPFGNARGTLPLPAQGSIIRRPGEPDAAGITRPGLLMATEPGALVSAPWPATVRYRGPLLDYGNVILLEPGEGYLLVMAGLDLVYPRVGDILPRGAALGLMPGAMPEEGEFLRTAPVAARSETLYLEIRENGLTIDPAAWFDLTGQEQ